MGIGIQGFRHIAIVVADLDRMSAFYAEVLGFDVLRTFELSGDFFGRGIGVPGAAARLVHLRIPNSEAELELLEFSGKQAAGAASPQADEQGFRHLTLVVDDMDAAVRLLEQRGVPFVSTPVTVPGLTFVYCRDPEGNIVELNQDVRR